VLSGLLGDDAQAGFPHIGADEAQGLAALVSAEEPPSSSLSP
jgi:hypothetical protein